MVHLISIFCLAVYGDAGPKGTKIDGVEGEEVFPETLDVTLDLQAPESGTYVTLFKSEVFDSETKINDSTKKKMMFFILSKPITTKLAGKFTREKPFFDTVAFYGLEEKLTITPSSLYFLLAIEADTLGDIPNSNKVEDFKTWKNGLKNYNSSQIKLIDNEKLPIDLTLKQTSPHDEKKYSLGFGILKVSDELESFVKETFEPLEVIRHFPEASLSTNLDLSHCKINEKITINTIEEIGSDDDYIIFFYKLKKTTDEEARANFEKVHTDSNDNAQKIFEQLGESCSEGTSTLKLVLIFVGSILVLLAIGATIYFYLVLKGKTILGSLKLGFKNLCK